MSNRTYSQLAGFKSWADRGLYDVINRNLDRLGDEDTFIVLRILDHIHVVDQIFKHHLQGVPHAFTAPRSAEVPGFQELASGTREVDDWYTSYVNDLSGSELDEPVEFISTSGKQTRMRRSEIILHVCLHGTSHRGKPLWFC